MKIKDNIEILLNKFPSTMKMSLKIGISFLFMCFEVVAQPVTETILFDNYVSPSDNDLVNNWQRYCHTFVAQMNGPKTGPPM